MISPATYKLIHQQDNIYTLKEERTRLLDFIHDYEQGIIDTSKQYLSPSPETLYSCNKEYLQVIEDLIKEINENNGSVKK